MSRAASRAPGAGQTEVISFCSGASELAAELGFPARGLRSSQVEPSELFVRFQQSKASPPAPSLCPNTSGAARLEMSNARRCSGFSIARVRCGAAFQQPIAPWPPVGGRCGQECRKCARFSGLIERARPGREPVQLNDVRGPTRRRRASPSRRAAPKSVRHSGRLTACEFGARAASPVSAVGNVRCMPDQSSAAGERAILQELTAPLTTLPDDPVAIAADADFPVVLRGYDRVAVDAYVKLTSQLVADLQATRSPETAMRRVTERMGEQISGIIQRAYDTAAQITAQARAEAEDMLAVARQEAAQVVAGGEQRLKGLDDDTDRIWAERLRIMEETRALIGQLSAVVESAWERFPPDEPEVTAEPEAAEPEVGAGPRSVAALSAGPEDDAADGDVTATPRPVGPTRDVPPSPEEEPPATR